MKSRPMQPNRTDVTLLGAAVIALIVLSSGERALTRPFATEASNASALRVRPFDRTVSISHGNLGNARAHDDATRRRVLSDFIATHADYFRLRDATERHLRPAGADASLSTATTEGSLILVTLRSDCAPSSHAVVIAGAFDARSGELRMVSARRDDDVCGLRVAGGSRAGREAVQSAGNVRLGL